MATVSDMNSVALANISHVNGVAVANIDDINGNEFLGATAVSVTNIDAIADGTEAAEMPITIDAENTGVGGTATIYWEIRDISDSLVDSGSEVISFSSGVNNNVGLSGIYYPARDFDYNFKCKETDDASWQEEPFNVLYLAE